MTTLFKKLVVVLALVILMLFIILLILSWNLGAFSAVDIRQNKRGISYFIAAQQDHPHVQSAEIINQIAALHPGGTGHGILLLDNPYNTPLPNVRCRAGLFRDDSISVDSPFQVLRIDSGLVVTAGMEANPTVALFKIYPALMEWIHRNGFTQDTTRAIIERYPRAERVEVEVSILPAAGPVF